MNENITDFISAVVADKPLDASDAFSKAIEPIVTQALDSKYEEMSKSLFGNQSEDIAEAKESTIDKIRKIVDQKQAMKINGTMVDMFTASAIMKIYNAVNDSNKSKMENMDVVKLANVAMKYLSKNK